MGRDENLLVKTILRRQGVFDKIAIVKRQKGKQA